MGQVWAGRDERLHRAVAVKLLRPEHLLPGTGAGADPRSSVGDSGIGTGTSTERRRHGDELRRRFLRECRVTAALDHPGLVTVFDAGEDGSELYLVMQRVPGVSLADLIAEDAPFPIERAVAVAAQLCAALAAVHAVPVVHRDLKPSNVMVREDGRTVLLDLGIATALDTETTRLTLTGVPIGSPAYMAPEQALASTTDPRSDLYALGCMLHEMLSGEEPFRAPTALGILRRHVDEPPVPLRDLRPDVPPALERLVLDLLAKQPADRPADAQAVYGRLLPLLPPAAAAPQPRYTPLPDPVRPFRYPHQPRPAAVAGAAAAPPEPRPFLVPPAPAVPPAPPAAPVAPAAPVVPAVPAVPAVGFDLAAECARLSDLVDAGRHEEVLDLAARLLPRAEAEQGGHVPLVRTIRTIYARTLLHQGHPGRALPEYQRLAVTAEGGPHGPQGLDHRYRAAVCLDRLGRGPEALAEYRALLTAHAEDPDPERAFDLRERIGLHLAAAGDPQQAWQWLLQLLLERERRDGPHHPAVRRLRQSLDTLHPQQPTPWPPVSR
ncbi:protein kinase domain-containing protein [Streptomyces sp. NRRL WC-3742]|uniref:protein kinase domain-containing protein n=1 Tax=Streptomyces sp. NRRL WC-3742 TaxID=1463934 RepID=UPI00068F4C63|nr:protein kinase [Streptomyces sp. NRRL WC-3742]